MIQAYSSNTCHCLRYWHKVQGDLSSKGLAGTGKQSVAKSQVTAVTDTAKNCQEGMTSTSAPASQSHEQGSGTSWRIILKQR